MQIPSSPVVASRPDRAPRSQWPSLWRNRDYWLLIGGQGISDIGTGVARIALPLLVLSMTGSYAQAGLVGGVQLVPYLLLCLPAGALVDRWDRKRVMVICDLGRALCAVSVALALALGHLTLTHLYLVALVSGTFFVFFNLAEVAALPRVVAPVQLPTANAQYELAYESASLIGPPLGSLCWSLGRALPFLADALSDVASVLSVLLIRAPLQAQTAQQAGHAAPGPRQLAEEIREGLRWLWAEPVVRINALIKLGDAAVLGGLILLLIALATRLGATAASAGALVACAAAGGIAGSLLVIALRRRCSYPQLVISSLWLTALLFPLYLAAPHPVLVGLVAAFQLCAATTFDIMQFTYRQARIPDYLQGRVNSIFRLFIYTGQPLGLASIGFLLERAGPVPTICLVTCIFVGLAALATVNPQVRRVK